jgi:hypothetical protein
MSKLPASDTKEDPMTASISSSNSSLTSTQMSIVTLNVRELRTILDAKYNSWKKYPSQGSYATIFESCERKNQGCSTTIPAAAENTENSVIVKYLHAEESDADDITTIERELKLHFMLSHKTPNLVPRVRGSWKTVNKLLDKTEVEYYLIMVSKECIVHNKKKI